MCSSCGCGHDAVSLDGKPLDHPHPHDHGLHRRSARSGAAAPTGAYRPLDAAHAPGLDAGRTLKIEQDLLAANDALAAKNRARLARAGIFALNFVSSPGSGKTSLLVDTITRWQHGPIAVIEGDQQTSNDAARIRATGATAVQINTGRGCHLDAHMVGHALAQLERQAALTDNSLLLIENVGNLVCPAAFDLGEAHKVVILSVTEGEDKPLKYPDMFRAADLLLLSKTDLLPHVDFDVEQAIAYARQVRPELPVIALSVKSGAGMAEWLAWLSRGQQAAAAHAG
ncbi:hydrogenase nickel incorporation protein HypB [Paludibacterium yongneupense]|uniref:hydrogenase nickel incorporation protein HypB n=1 Tax=Paludibacterium yongneupense TaxID=400061 RepID=UPI0004255B87|nr:hydrogenase nickel incorporation protein HypB [Paludibacterium yongneupense]